MYDILIPGNYFCDLIFTGFPTFPSLGSEVYTQGLNVTVGGSLNTVIAMRRLGVNVGWMGQIGTDLFSQFVLNTVEKEGIDTSMLTRIDAPYQRVTVSVSYPHDRAFITYIDPTRTVAQMLIDAIDTVQFRHLHFTGLQLDPRLPALVQRIRAQGLMVTMDCQDRPDTTLDTPGVRDIITTLDMFMPNAKEAMQLAERTSVAEAAEVLRPLVPTLVIKDGGNGAFAWHESETWHQPALSLTPVDTTGAGDVFNAGFLAAFLQGDPLPTCLRWGNICGGLSTQGSGGTSTAPHRHVVESML